MSGRLAKLYNQAMSIVYLDTYVPETSRSLATMEQLVTYRLEYFVSRMRAALGAHIDEPKKWDRGFLLEMMDLETVSVDFSSLGQFLMHL
jgi:hypothetical protein